MPLVYCGPPAAVTISSLTIQSPEKNFACTPCSRIWRTSGRLQGDSPRRRRPVLRPNFGDRGVKVFSPRDNPSYITSCTPRFASAALVASASLTVGVFVVNDHHPFGFQLVDNEIAGDLTLLVIAAAHAEHIAHAALGNLRVGGAVMAMIPASLYTSEAGMVDEEQK